MKRPYVPNAHVLKIAAASDTDPRTVRLELAGMPGKGRTRERVRAAIVAAGYALPAAASRNPSN